MYGDTGSILKPIIIITCLGVSGMFGYFVAWPMVMGYLNPHPYVPPPAPVSTNSTRVLCPVPTLDANVTAGKGCIK